MTSYLTSVGVQQFSITIAVGSTTGTASINAVGSGAFILFGGVNISGAPTTNSEAFAYLTLSNSTTVTATRSVSTAGSLTITGCIVDGDTTNLVKSVQYGTISIANLTSSGTATISSVTNVNAAVHLLGWNTNNSAYSAVNENPILSLSGITVAASRKGSVGNLTIGFVVIEFQGGALNQNVQNVSVTSSANVTSYTATISSVVTNNSIILSAGSDISSVTNRWDEALQYAQLTNSTTVTANVFTGTANAKTYNCSVVEFSSGILNSSIKRNTTTLSGVLSATTTIASVNISHSAISWLGNTTNLLSGAAGNGGAAMATLLNSTTVKVSQESSSGSPVGSWEVAEFTSSFGGVTGDAIWFGMTV